MDKEESVYPYGEIYDCRTVLGLEHFIVILGSNGKQVFYLVLTSRTYKAFDYMCVFISDCLSGGCKSILNHFSKEKDNDRVVQRCDTRHAFFLDKKDYQGILSSHSMLVLNKGPEKKNKEIFDDWVGKGDALSKCMLVGRDYFQLKAMIDWSEHISDSDRVFINASFNKKKKEIREKELGIREQMRKGGIIF